MLVDGQCCSAQPCPECQQRLKLYAAGMPAPTVQLWVLLLTCALSLLARRWVDYEDDLLDNYAVKLAEVVIKVG